MNENLVKLSELLAKSTLENWQEHKFPTENDETLFLVLKAHMLIEEKLDLIINTYFGDEKITKKLSLNFARKATLAEAICTQYLGKNWWDEFLWPTIAQLNTSRNRLAHNLSPNDIPKRLAELVRMYDKLGKLHEESYKTQTGSVLPRVSKEMLTDVIKLRSLFFSVLSQLDGLLVGLMAMNEVIAKAVSSSGITAFDEAQKVVSQFQISARLKNTANALDEVNEN